MAVTANMGISKDKDLSSDGMAVKVSSKIQLLSSPSPRGIRPQPTLSSKPQARQDGTPKLLLQYPGAERITFGEIPPLPPVFVPSKSRGAGGRHFRCPHLPFSSRSL